MDKGKRKMIEGWIDKASNQLQAAKEHSKSSIQYSEAIQAAQECIELSVKSTLSLLDITFSPSHGWEQDKKQFAAIAEQIQKKQLIDKLTAQYLNHIAAIPVLASNLKTASICIYLEQVKRDGNPLGPLWSQGQEIFQWQRTSSYRQISYSH